MSSDVLDPALRTLDSSCPLCSCHSHDSRRLSSCVCCRVCPTRREAHRRDRQCVLPEEALKLKDSVAVAAVAANLDWLEAEIEQIAAEPEAAELFRIESLRRCIEKLRRVRLQLATSDGTDVSSLFQVKCHGRPVRPFRYLGLAPRPGCGCARWRDCPTRPSSRAAAAKRSSARCSHGKRPSTMRGRHGSSSVQEKPCSLTLPLPLPPRIHG
jgi:hypothetical protein